MNELERVLIALARRVAERLAAEAATEKEQAA